MSAKLYQFDNFIMIIIINKTARTVAESPRDAAIIRYKCTKHQFMHLLTTTCNAWHIENSKNHKKWYHSPPHRLTVNVLLNNITFLWFLLFSMCQALHVAV